MMRAFNLCNDPEKPWAYAPDVQERVKLLIGELMSVFDTSTLIGQGNAAKIDAGFQRFIAGLNLKNI